MNHSQNEILSDEKIVSFPYSLRARIDALERSGNLSVEAIDDVIVEFLKPLQVQVNYLKYKLQYIINENIHTIE